jgi:arginyl-tRNA synthetase
MTLTDTIRAAFEKAFPGEDFASVRVVPATDSKFGDYQCNDALKIAKKFRLNPREAAAKVVENLDRSCFDKVEIAGPGFLNLTVSAKWLAESLERFAASENNDGNKGINQHKE